MKRIDIAHSLQISELINSEELGIAEYALEKDFIVTEILEALTKNTNPWFDLIFCGGTCLSKAYGLLSRISEDVDIKVVLKPDIYLTRNNLRSALSKLKAEVCSNIFAAGFNAEDVEVVVAKDDNKYVVVNVAYESRFAQAHDMRSKVQLELNYTSLSLPQVNRGIGLLFDELSGVNTRPVFHTPCIDLTEAVVEKLVSFPRRLAMYLEDGTRKLDPALIRHLYDVHEVVSGHPSLIADHPQLKELMLSAMEKDAKDFARQHDQFLADPVGELNNAMAVVRTEPAFAAIYERFVQVMVYQPSPPVFDVVLCTFERMLLLALPPATINFLKFRSGQRASPLADR
jgi:hypothetical protein